MTTFAVCRRVHGRRFMMRPDELLTGLVIWMLCLFATALGVQVHAATFMSSHYHLVLSVDEQKVSKLMELLNANLAKAINVLRRAPRGILWEPGQLSIVECKTVDAVVYEIAYAIVNPVAAGLVWEPKDWPGLCVLAEDIGTRVLEGRRPGFFFRDLAWDEVARLEITWPPCLLALGEDEARRLVEAEVARQLAEAHAEIRAKHWRVLGALAAKSVSPFKRAKTWETFGSLHPHLATGPGRVEERMVAIAELKAFRAQYRAAWRRYRAGERDVVFPYGTYLLRVRHGVATVPPPT